MIKTADDLIDYTMRRLGAPLIEVEVTEDQVMDAIEYSIKEFSQFAYDGELEESVVLTVNGRGHYPMPDFVTSIIAVRSIAAFNMSVQNYVPDRWSEQFFAMFESGGTGIDAIIALSSVQTLYDKYMLKEINYTFNEYTNTIHVHEDYTGNLCIHYTKAYTPEKRDGIYNQQWVKDMVVAQTRMQQSTVTGKYSQALVGGATINYDNMRALAESEIESLKEDLFLKYAGPAPISIA